MVQPSVNGRSYISNPLYNRPSPNPAGGPAMGEPRIARTNPPFARSCPRRTLQTAASSHVSFLAVRVSFARGAWKRPRLYVIAAFYIRDSRTEALSAAERPRGLTENSFNCCVIDEMAVREGFGPLRAQRSLQLAVRHYPADQRCHRCRGSFAYLALRGISHDSTPTCKL